MAFEDYHPGPIPEVFQTGRHGLRSRLVTIDDSLSELPEYYFAFLAVGPSMDSYAPEHKVVIEDELLPGIARRRSKRYGPRGYRVLFTGGS